MPLSLTLRRKIHITMPLISKRISAIFNIFLTLLGAPATVEAHIRADSAAVNGPLDDRLHAATAKTDSVLTQLSLAETVAWQAAAVSPDGAGTVAADSLVRANMAAAERKMAKKTKVNIYDMPYSTKASCPDWGRMWLHTGVLYAAGIATLGVLELLPDNATAWNKERVRSIPFWKRWSYHVSRGPVWDGDNFIFNYILHPYAGAVYYMGARSIGFNRLGSFLYCTAISTLFWEYGIEAFMEKPSIQDLILTPLSGLLIGECFYKLKRKIVSDGYRLWGSRTWGNIVAFLIDPVNELIGLFAGNPCRQALKRKSQLNVSCMPWATPMDGGTFGLTVSITR